MCDLILEATYCWCKSHIYCCVSSFEQILCLREAYPFLRSWFRAPFLIFNVLDLHLPNGKFVGISASVATHIVRVNHSTEALL